MIFKQSISKNPHPSTYPNSIPLIYPLTENGYLPSDVIIHGSIMPDSAKVLLKSSGLRIVPRRTNDKETGVREVHLMAERDINRGEYGQINDYIVTQNANKLVDLNLILLFFWKNISHKGISKCLNIEFILQDWMIILPNILVRGLLK